MRPLLVLVGTAAYMLLPILAWGGFGPFFSQPALIAVTIVTFAAAIVSIPADGNCSPGVREDRSNRWVLWVFAPIGLLQAFVPAWTDRIGFWTIDGEATRWIGVAIYTVGTVLRMWPVFVLGHRFSGLVAIQRGHELVTSGIYGTIRHPSYLGLLTMALGWCLAFRSGIGVLLTALLVPAIVARIHSEERLLQSAFGKEYDAYRARTSRLIPGVY
jgi:protein-S-isoprenylcysteine O-methyltransferase Ste14